MNITFYSVDYTKSLPVFPGKIQRDWIDNADHLLYNDLTLTMACQSGWEFRAPDDFTIEWNGGSKPTDLCVHSYTKDAHLFNTGMGHGICSIRTWYVIKTEGDYSVLSMGAPNFFVDGAVQLTSLVETNWTHMTFYLNWKMTRPGKVTFKKGDPIGFITIIPHRQLENVELKIDSLMADLELYNRFLLWQQNALDIDPYKEGIENSETLEKTTKYHITNRSLEVHEQE